MIDVNQETIDKVAAIAKLADDKIMYWVRRGGEHSERMHSLWGSVYIGAHELGCLFISGPSKQVDEVFVRFAADYKTAKRVETEIAAR